MRVRSFLLTSAIVSALPECLAHPGSRWKESLAQVEAEILKRAPAASSGPDSNELLGDLIYPGPMTPIGKAIAGILAAGADAQSDEPLGGQVAPLESDACRKDTCCTWKYISDEMLMKFRGPSFRCNNFARGAVRLGFHDAGAWKKGLTSGGADGSMILTNEITRPANKGLEEIVTVTKAWYDKYSKYGISAADLIQMGANVATVACPMGPRIRTYVGRKDNPQLPPDGLLPDVNDDADKLIKMFEDKSISPSGLVSLVGAHTVSQQRFVQPQRALDPQDGTPGAWDALIYPQTLDPRTPKRIFKFPSDVKLSQHPRTAGVWWRFSLPGGQDTWNEGFATEYVRLSLLGVNNINSLQDCTKVLPPRTPHFFNPPDQSILDKWLQGGFGRAGQYFGQLVADAQSLTNSSLQLLGVDPKDAGTPANIPGASANVKRSVRLPSEVWRG